MSAISFLPFVLEFLLVSVALRMFFSGNFLNSRPRLFLSGLFFLTVPLVVVSMVLGGTSVVAMVVKVLFFVLAIVYAISEPRAARWWLIAAIVTSLLVQASAGNVLNKLSTLPFLMIACLWATTRARLRTGEFVVLALAIGAEFIQAIALESRGLLIAGVMACWLMLGPLNLVRRTVVISAILLPIIYPLGLTLVFTSLLSGSDFLDATSSNFERSAMAAWSVDNFSSYPLVGPGSILFTAEINAIKVLGQQAVGDNYDPHQFLLSAWILLGSSITVVLYIFWCSIWIFKGSNRFASNRRTRLFSILAILAILIFVFSPPDTTARVQVAILAGIAIAGLRDPSILMRKLKSSMPDKTDQALTPVLLNHAAVNK